MDKDKNSNEPDFNEINMTDEELLDEFERAKRIICDEIPKAPPDEFEIIWQRIMREEDDEKQISQLKVKNRMTEVARSSYLLEKQKKALKVLKNI